MQQILTGIYSAYDADTYLEAALPGGLHFEMAPQGTAMTYAVYSVVSPRTEYMFDGEEYEYLWLQFDIYAATHSARLTACEKLDAVYQNIKISATGYTPKFFHRRGKPALVRDGQENEIRRAIIEYNALWEKS